MTAGALNLELQITELARQYGDHLITNYCVNDECLFWQKHWQHAEHIDAGISGVLLFLIELYKYVPDERYLKIIDQTVNDLLIYSRENNTGNYSLYTGRAGLVYVLLQYYSIRNDEKLISACLDLMREADADFLHNDYTSNYLYDGRAGTLLVLLQLYLVSKEPAVLHSIKQFVHKIIETARLSSRGVYWMGKEEIEERTAARFLNGSSGIKYVLSRLNSYCAEPVLQFVTDEIDRHEGASALSDPPVCSKKQSCGHNCSIGQQVKCINEQHFVYDMLLNGFAGHAMGLLEKQEMGDNELQQVIIQLIKYTSSKKEFNIDGGLLHGDLGIVYFLLRAIGRCENNVNEFLPFVNNIGDRNSDKIDISISSNEIKKAFIVKRYPRTVQLIIAVFPGYIDGFLQTLPASDVSNAVNCFAATIQQGITGLSSPVNERIQDLFSWEKKRSAFAGTEERSRKKIYLDELTYLDKALESLNKPDEWLLTEVAGISTEITLLQAKWDWRYQSDFAPPCHAATLTRHMHNLNTPPTGATYFFRFVNKGELVEVSLKKADLLILKAFEQPRNVKAGIKDIKGYINGLSEQALNKFLYDLGYADVINAVQFLQLLDRMVLDYIKQFIYRKILVLQ
jgi:hypothetical protein